MIWYRNCAQKEGSQPSTCIDAKCDKMLDVVSACDENDAPDPGNEAARSHEHDDSKKSASAVVQGIELGSTILKITCQFRIAIIYRDAGG